MSQRSIIITDSDRQHLEHVLASDFAQVTETKPYIADLRAELQHAQIVESTGVPHDVITMNSTIRLLDLDTREEDTYTLVYPEQANIADGKLSILAPIGTAILGYRVGDIVHWRVPSGKRRLKIVEVLFQPERAAANQH